MQKQLQLVFNHVESSDGLKELAATLLEKIESLNSDITSCHIVFAAEPNHQFSVTIEMQAMHNAFESTATDADAYSALRQAFKKLNRILQDHSGKLRASRYDSEQPVVEEPYDTDQEEAVA
ncbi:ribosomal subunit interface protein [Sinobacterium caligoides]|uniref:Ribosomal subunit interface protein n=1 Tax=Sinobacterium caligoides TaxID=933926 RepID=A0A3N2DMY8_9GAMM|nr:HPF/RaiA family ribosome-associated protein [Sinobacterium caligoides]ROS01174.1 ribosomal subunit interface protein [Sinobacterium caligoides]